MTKTKQSIYWIIGLAVTVGVAVVGLIALGGIGGATGYDDDTATPEFKPYVAVRSGSHGLGHLSYTGYYIHEPQPGGSVDTLLHNNSMVEIWRYAVRWDDTCDSSVFKDGGRAIGDNIALKQLQNGDLAYVIYGSNEFEPEGKQVALDGAYICFAPSLTDGRWLYGGTRLELAEHDGVLPDNWDELTVSEKIALNPYDCPDLDRIRADNGRCLGDTQTTIPNMWDTVCVTEDSQREGSIPEEAWCEEDDDREVVKGGIAAALASLTGGFDLLEAVIPKIVAATAGSCPDYDSRIGYARSQINLSFILAVGDWAEGSATDADLREFWNTYRLRDDSIEDKYGEVCE